MEVKGLERSGSVYSIHLEVESKGPGDGTAEVKANSGSWFE